MAIAALGGPLPAAATAGLKEVVKYALERYESSAPTRDLQQQVSRSVREWAEGERIGADTVELGLGLATRVVARFGVTDEETAALDYDPGKAQRAVVARAAAQDRYWGTEDHHQVAVAAIEVTYTALFQRLRGSEKVLLPAVRVLRDDIGAYADRVEEGFQRMDDQFADVKGDLAALRAQVNTLRPETPADSVIVANLVVMIGQGEYVKPSAITAAGPDAVNPIVAAIFEATGLDPASLLSRANRTAPDEQVSRQIAAVVAAQQELTSTREAPIEAEAAYRLGMLAAYDRDDDTALAYLNQATTANADYTAAYDAIAWLQHARAVNELSRPEPDLDAAANWLEDARRAAMHTDPCTPRSLALRGFVAKTLAQVAQARCRSEEMDRHNADAARLFEQAVNLGPSDDEALTGLGNMLYARGDLDGAIAAYRRAVALAPGYTAAHHDLAIALAAKADAEPSDAATWLALAIDSLQTAYLLAPTDPSFDEGSRDEIARYLAWLKSQRDEAAGPLDPTEDADG